ncbi:MAG: tRNA pseudouridine(38-40) synthase TruA [Muribaculaceae bacterium]|nr:tRNA pseudouridine(38-40) synthase TruA [Muribaculaceae bacterium]
MMRYFLHLAYNGLNYHGWQRQPGAISVQEKIEDGLALLLRHPVSLVGAGRTDAGVNAAMMIAHFDTAVPIPDKNRFLASLNGIVDPFNIAFYDLFPVSDNAHARFDAVDRTYRYYVHIRRSPFLYPYSLQVPPTVDFDLMNEAAKILLEVDDFTSFAKLHSDVKTNICHVTSARWEPYPADPSRYYFEITANRFLRNMVRAVTGTLLEIGRGKMTLDRFRQVIDQKNRSAAGTSLPPSPLFLHHITYNYI